MLYSSFFFNNYLLQFVINLYISVLKIGLNYACGKSDLNKMILTNLFKIGPDFQKIGLESVILYKMLNYGLTIS